LAGRTMPPTYGCITSISMRSVMNMAKRNEGRYLNQTNDIKM